MISLETSMSTPAPFERSPFARPARRIRWVLFAAMSLSSAASIAMATINSIAGADLGGSPAWAGVPSATILIGSALAAPLWGELSARIGRRGGLVLGLVLGIVGAVLSGMALALASLPLFLGGLILIGVTGAAVGLSRFAAADVHPPELRARALSTVVLGGAIGSIAGPALVSPSGLMASRAGWTELTGPYAASMLLFAAAALVVYVMLRPEPSRLGREVAAAFGGDVAATGPVRPVGTILRSRGAFLAVTAMTLGQMVMVMVMVITSLHMRDHEHALGSISFVIGAHTFGMFAFSVISGRLADRLGRLPVIVAGSATLVLACLTAPLSPDVVPLAVSLFLLGLGWNFCYVGGSALLADQLRPGERARTQGVNDLLVGAGSAAGSLASGLIFGAVGYAAMASIGAAFALIPLSLALAWRRTAAAPA
jgi:MFS family permease